jgi:hypothetical protein
LLLGILGQSKTLYEDVILMVTSVWHVPLAQV